MLDTNDVRDRLIRLPRIWKRAILVGFDLAAVIFASISSLFLHGRGVRDLIDPLWPIALLLVFIPFVAALGGLYVMVIRYIAIRTAFSVFLSIFLIVVGLLCLGTVFTAPLLVPPVAINFGVILGLALGASRLIARWFLASGLDADAERIVIFGAGSAGAQLAQSLALDRRRRVFGFIDGQKELVNTTIAGLRVYSAKSLSYLIESRGIDTVLLALPSASRHRKQQLLDFLEPFQVMVKTVPTLQAILSGEAKISDIRDIEIEDLLGRDPVPPDEALLSESIAGRVVMVTGAGGSIGSELCRQVAQLRPARLILFEINEHALFNIDCELRRTFHTDAHTPAIVPMMGDVRDSSLVDVVIRRFGVQTLYHAAAYKHVPLVEQNVGASLRNNVFGTWNVAEAAAGNGVERFILISTDKAVRPTNIMGATKRVAELIVQAVALRENAKDDEKAGCVFSMVRFGNVLGSSGSVVPYFREQIRSGGPVTVTDKAITRFFMTIPEAAQLVIQAGAMADGGEVFVLDMGEPVKIVELAERMIHLAGLTIRDPSNPEGDIDIVFTGLRPGEKLHEELLIGEAGRATAHSKIGCADECGVSWSVLAPMLDQMGIAVESYQSGHVKSLLQELVSEYSAASQDHDVICAETYTHDVSRLA